MLNTPVNPTNQPAVVGINSGSILLEIILALNLSLLLILALVTQWQYVIGLSKWQQNKTNNYELTYFANKLSQDISLAGFSNSPLTQAINPIAIAELNSNSVAIATNKQIDLNITSNKDCLNQNTKLTNSILNKYWLDTTKLQGAIMCKGSGSNKSDHLVNHIHSWQVWYAIDLATSNDGVIDKFVTPVELANMTNIANNNNTMNNKILAVKISATLVTTNNNPPNKLLQTTAVATGLNVVRAITKN